MPTHPVLTQKLPDFRFSEFVRARTSIYRELAKSGIVALVLISVLGGYLAGQSFEEPLQLTRLLGTLLGILFLASGSSALNQFQERSIDGAMPRTAGRPLPAGRISEREALAFITITLAAGIAILGYLDSRLALLGALAVVSYNGLYTLWWKKHWAFAAIPGAVPGALPILMGYLAASGKVFAPPGLYLFFILFFWQMPHFWVLALKYSDDYNLGGIPTLPVARGVQVTTAQIRLWCLAYLALSMLAPLVMPVGTLYLVVAVAVGIKLLLELARFTKSQDGKSWLHFFLWINFSLILYIAAIVGDLWHIYLIPYFGS